MFALHVMNWIFWNNRSSHFAGMKVLFIEQCCHTCDEIPLLQHKKRNAAHPPYRISTTVCNENSVLAGI